MKGCTHIKAHPSKSFFHQYRQLREYIGHPAGAVKIYAQNCLQAPAE